MLTVKRTPENFQCVGRDSNLDKKCLRAPCSSSKQLTTQLTQTGPQLASFCHLCRVNMYRRTITDNAACVDVKVMLTYRPS